jgi:hypothetical protein
LNIVHGGVILIVYVFVVIACYTFISGAFEDVISSVEDVNSTASDTEVESAGTTLRTVFDLMFAGLVLVPVIWFVYWVFSREPDWRYR